MTVTALPYIGAKRRVVVTEEPYCSILRRAQRAGFDPTLDAVIDTFNRDVYRAAMQRRAR